jgi:hypothetical protein
MSGKVCNIIPSSIEICIHRNRGESGLWRYGLNKSSDIVYRRYIFTHINNDRVLRPILRIPGVGGLWIHAGQPII